MSLIELRNVCKNYKDGNETQKVLKNINLKFDDSGFVVILGKSGSGKSTLLNIISMLEKPTSGKVYINGKSVEKLKEKEVIKYRKQFFGIVFQKYNLLENQTAIYNVMLPMLIDGEENKRAEDDAKTLLQSIKFPEKLYSKLVKDLSGGEKQRLGILRGLIRAPFVVIADEPTGALDSYNGDECIKLLKTVSKTRLVIIVTHNDKIAQSYADRIITISDGAVINDKIINSFSMHKNVVLGNKKRLKNSWIDKITFNNLKNHKKINIFTTISLCFEIICSSLCLGLYNGAKKSIHSQIRNHFDYGSAFISKETVSEKTASGLSIVKSLCPGEDEIANEIKEKFYVEPNYDTILLSNFNLRFEEIENIQITPAPVYSFETKDFVRETLVLGDSPAFDSLIECVINESAYCLLQENGFKLGDNLEFNFIYEDVVDYNCIRLINRIEYNTKMKVKGICSELKFLSTPKLYYSYLALNDYFGSVEMEQLGITWRERVFNSKGDDSINGFSKRIFLRNLNDDVSTFNNYADMKITSSAIQVSQALEELVDASSFGMTIFVAIAGLGTIFTFGIITFYLYSTERKTSALYKALGSRNSDIFFIYANEGIVIGVISLILSFPLLLFLEYVCNYIIEGATGLKSVIKIPWIISNGISVPFPCLLLCAVFAVCLASVAIPMLFSKPFYITK